MTNNGIIGLMIYLKIKMLSKVLSFKNILLLVAILSLSCVSSIAAEKQKQTPAVAPGTPVGAVKSWDYPQKITQLRTSFLGKNDRYDYFLEEITNFPDVKEGRLYDFLDPAAGDFEQIDPWLFDKIRAFKYLDKPERERVALNNINKFLAQNYKNKILPGKVYRTSANLPEPFYLSDLKKWTFTAVRKGDIKAVRAFLDNYNLLNIKDDEGYNLLAYAIQYHQNDIAELLIRRGININEENKYGASPLIIAARSNNVEAVKMLLKSNCKVNHKDQFGNTSKDYAVINNNQEVCQYLAQEK